jgi:hypothetical protein
MLCNDGCDQSYRHDVAWLQASVVDCLRDVQTVAGGALRAAIQSELDVFVCAVAQMTSTCCVLFQQQPGARGARCAGHVHVAVMGALAATARSITRRLVPVPDQAIALLRGLRNSGDWPHGAHAVRAEVAASAEQVIHVWRGAECETAAKSSESLARQVQGLLQV